MRVVEISDPSSFHSAQWVNQLLQRRVETYATYIEGWFDSSIDKLKDIANLKYKLFIPPTKRRILASLIKTRKIGTVAKSLMHNTMIHGELELLAPSIAQYFRDEEINVVHAHYVHSGGFIAYSAGYEPCVLSTWGSDLTDGPDMYPYYIPLMKKTIEWATIINAASSVSAELVRSFAPVEENRMFVSSWGADTDLFNPNLDTYKLRSELGVPDGPVVLSFRALEPYYRIDIIIKAFKIVLQRHPEAVLVVGNDGPQREELELLARSLLIADRVVFTGYETGERMANIFSMSDIYIQCPLSDGVSVSGMQALASGLAMIANDVGETSALIQEGFNGFLLPDSDSPDMYANAIIKLLDDRELLERMCANSRKLSEETHNRKLFLDRLLHLFKCLSEGARNLDSVF